MLKFRWNFQWVVFFIALLNMVVVLVVSPTKSSANTPESSKSSETTDSSILSTINNDDKIASTPEQSPESVDQDNQDNNLMEQITPVSDILSPGTTSLN